MSKRLKRAVVAAIIFFLWVLFTLANTDFSISVFVTALIGISVILLCIIALASFVFGIVNLKRRQPIWFVVAAAIVLFLVTSFSVSIWVNNSDYSRSVDSGNSLVDAIERYEQDHGAFPDSLSILLPNYIDTIPVAKIGFVRSIPFRYEAAERTFRLSFPRPAWMICTYDSRIGEWVTDD